MKEKRNYENEFRDAWDFFKIISQYNKSIKEYMDIIEKSLVPAEIKRHAFLEFVDSDKITKILEEYINDGEMEWDK